MANDGESQAVGNVIINIVSHILAWFKFVLIGITRLISIKRLFNFILCIGIGLVIASFKSELIDIVENFVVRQNSELENILVVIFTLLITYLPLITAFFYLIHIGKLDIERKKIKLSNLFKLPKRKKKAKSVEAQTENIVNNNDFEEIDGVKEESKYNLGEFLKHDFKNEIKKELKTEIKKELKEEFNNS